MDKFKKNETIAVLFILICILSVSFFNFRLALRRARDSQRRSDVNSIYNALVTFREKVGVFPFADEKGRIKACKGENYESDLKKLNSAEMSVNQFLENLRGCDWGYDA